MSEFSLEATGETVSEAKWAALRELERLRPGIDKASVRFQVVSEGERGLLGVGYEPARVIASIDEDAVAAAPAVPPRAFEARAGESEDAALAREVVERIAGEAGAGCEVEVEEGDEQITVTCLGGDLAILIGRHGQTIDAIQYLANSIVNRDRREGRARIVVDASGYRARRSGALEALAARSAERASATGERVELEPMSAVERRVVHEFLEEDPEVETTSEGNEPNRFVVIIPRHVV